MTDLRPEAANPEMLEAIITRMKIGYRDDGYFDKDARRLYNLAEWFRAERAAHDASQHTIRELRADKERLDWFDANIASVADVCGIPDAETPLFMVTLLTHDSHEIFRGETLREAIDAARSAPERGEALASSGVKPRSFICWAIRDGDKLFYQGSGYPTLYATMEEAERDIRNPRLDTAQVEVLVRELSEASSKLAQHAAMRKV